MLNSFLLLLGPLTPAVKELLDYEASAYDDVPLGTIVSATAFSCDTDEISQDLATAVGVDPWDFSEHNIDDDENFTWEMLEEMSPLDAARLRVFLEEGFAIMFQPNAVSDLANVG